MNEKANDFQSDNPDPIPDDLAAQADSIASELDALELGGVMPKPVDPEAETVIHDTSGDEPAEAVAGVSDRDADTPDDQDGDDLVSLDELDTVLETHEKAEQKRQEDQERVEAVARHPMPRPEPLALNRGSSVSWLPGLALIGIGAWLTFAYTTDAAPPPTTVGAILVGLFALMLIMSWMASGRWNRGSLFLAMWGILSAGGTVSALEALGAASVPAALLAAFGGALFLSGAFARPISRAVIFGGLIFLAAGGVLFAAVDGYIPPTITDTLVNGWIAVAVIAGLVIVLPFLRRLWSR